MIEIYAKHGSHCSASTQEIALLAATNIEVEMGIDAE